MTDHPQASPEMNGIKIFEENGQVESPPTPHEKPAEETADESKKLTFWQAVGLNTMNMFGTGPLITIPYCVAAVDPMGPHALFGYGVACVACMCDSFVWGEMGSMWPDSGGSFVYLRELYGAQTYGRLIAFMFVWQFFISGPAEVASGFIAIAEYLVYFSDDTVQTSYRILISLGMLLVCLFLMMRKLTDIGRVTLVLWAITIVAMIYTLLSGFSDFHSEYLEMPQNAFSSTSKSIWIIAAATRFGVYDMTGYYDVCFLGQEVQKPRTTIPRSCVMTCMVVAVIYIFVYLSVLGSFNWKEFIFMYTDDYEGVPVGIMSIFTEIRWESKALAYIVTIVVCITIFGSTFAMLCGMVYIPVAAARDGYFFSIFDPAKTPKALGGPKQSEDSIPVVSLLVMMVLSGVWCFFSLDLVIDAMTTMLVLVQFSGQSFGLMYYRYTTPKSQQPAGWHMPLFPLPCIVQLVIFLFIFATTDSAMNGKDPVLELSIAFLVLGVIMFALRSKYRETWPFGPTTIAKAKRESKTESEPTCVLTSPTGMGAGIAEDDRA